MEFTNEMLEKAKTAKNVAELRALAQENNIEITEEEANSYFAELHKSGELADNELDNVAGGDWCEAIGNYESGSEPEYRQGQHVQYHGKNATTPIGEVILVRLKKSGKIHTEFTYDIRLEDGTVEQYVYESQIFRAW